MMRRAPHLTGFFLFLRYRICTHPHTTEQTQKNSGFFFFFKHTPKVTAIPETFGRLSHVMTITGILEGKRMLREGQTALYYKRYFSPRVLPTPSTSLPGRGGWRLYSTTLPRQHSMRSMLSHCSMILVCSVSLSFEVRHFLMVRSLIPKDVRLTVER